MAVLRDGAEGGVLPRDRHVRGLGHERRSVATPYAARPSAACTRAELGLKTSA
jgi:hypothetical protein